MRIRKHWYRLPRSSRICGLFLVVLFLCSLIGPELIVAWKGYTYQTQDLANQLTGPSWNHPFGTDLFGRDLLSRVLAGTRTSIWIGLSATAISILIGVSVGAVSGYFGGVLDDTIMRTVEAFYCLPYMILVAILIAFFERGMVLLTLALGAVSWLTMARVVRGQVLHLRQQPYVDAARALGLSELRVLVRHVLPNTLEVIVVYTTLTIPSIILNEAFLSFLGFGVSPPRVSWGVLVLEGAQAIAVRPLLLLAPAVLLGLVFFSLNTLGEGLRDVLRVQFRR